MKLSKIEIRNFKSHKYFENDIPQGLVLISGRNGTGKSSLIESIYSAIVGKGYSRTLNQMITNGEDSGYLSLEFYHDNSMFSVIRFYGKNSKTEIRKDNHIIASSATEVKNIINQIVTTDVLDISFIRDIDIKKFLMKMTNIENIQKVISALYNKYQLEEQNILQKKTFTTNQLNSCEEMMNKLIGKKNQIINEIEECKKNIVETCYTKEDIVEIKKKQQNFMSIFLEEKEKILNELSDYRKIFSEKNIERSNLANTLKYKRSEIDKLYQDELRNAKMHLEREINDKKSELVSLEHQKKMIEKEIEHIDIEFDNKIKFLQNSRSSDINMLVRKKEELEREKKRIQLEIEKITKNFKDLVELGICPQCRRKVDEIEGSKIKNAYQDEIDSLNKKIMKINDDLNAIEKEKEYIEHDYKNRVEEINHERNITKNNLKKMKLDSVIVKIIDCKREIDLLQVKLNDVVDYFKPSQEVAKTITTLEKECDHIIRKIEQLDFEIINLNEKITYLEDTVKDFKNYFVQYLMTDILQKINLKKEELDLDTDVLEKTIDNNEKLKVIINEKKKTLIDIDAEIAETEKKVMKYQQELTELNSEIEDTSKILLSYKFLTNTRSLNKFVLTYICKMISDTIASMNDIMQVKLDLDDNDNLKIYAVNLNGNLVSQDFLSQGETVMMTLSLYIALKKMFKDDFPYMFLDEFLDKLDSENSKLVIDYLKNMSYNGYTFFVVTHKNELQTYDIWDYIIEL